MNFFPTILGMAAILATGFGLTSSPQPKLQLRPAVAEKEPLEICIDDLALPIKTIEEFKESFIPKDILRLNSKRVRMVGQMFPPFEQFKIKEFVFNGDTRLEKTYRCGSSDIPIQCFVWIEMRKGETTAWTQQPIEIEGEFVIDPDVEDGVLYGLYLIKDATVRPGKRRTGMRVSVGFGC